MPPSLQIGDAGLVSGEPCGQPCFFGIQPDISTLTDTKHFINANGLDSSCQDFDTRRESGTRGIYCWGEMSFGYDDHDYVAGIGIVPTKDTALGDVIRKNGVPDAFEILVPGTPESPPRTSAVIYFDHFSMRLFTKEQSGYLYELDSAVLFDNVSYETVRQYSLVRHTAPPWKGFGKFGPSN